LLKLAQGEVKELRAFQKQTESFEQSLRREVMNKIDVFLEHAARYIMTFPEASLFTDSLPQPFLNARRDNASGQGASELESSPFFGPVLSSKLADDRVQPPVFRAFKDVKNAEKKEKKKMVQRILKSVHDRPSAKKHRRLSRLQQKQASERQQREAHDALEDVFPPVVDEADPVPHQPLGAASPPVVDEAALVPPRSFGTASPPVVKKRQRQPSPSDSQKNQDKPSALKKHNLKQMRQQQPSKKNAAQKEVQEELAPRFLVLRQTWCKPCNVKLGLGHCKQCKYHIEHPPPLKHKRQSVPKRHHDPSANDDDIFAIVSTQNRIMA
jgi:hypothetical protein